MPDDCGNIHSFKPTADDYLDAVSDTVVAFTIVCTVIFVLTVLLYVECSRYIRRYYVSHALKRRTLYILIVFPLVSLCALGVLIFPRSTLFLDLVGNTLVAIGVYNVILLVPSHFKGVENMSEALRQDDVYLGRHPPCCCCFCCCPVVRFSRKTIYVAMALGMQIAFVMPFLGVIAVVLWLDDSYENGEIDTDDGYIFITIPTVMSIMACLYGSSLLTFTIARKLKHLRLVPKLLVIKVALVIRNLQSAIFSLLKDNDVPDCDGILTSAVVGESINHMLVVGEMFLLLLVARSLFCNPESGQYYTGLEPLRRDSPDRQKYGTTNDVETALGGSGGDAVPTKDKSSLLSRVD